MLADARNLARFTAGLGPYLREAPSLAASRRRIDEQLRQREARFLAVLERGVFARPESPYLWLFRQAGVAREDVVELVRREGLEPALGRLHDAGVRLSAAEFKGRVPLERGGRSRRVRHPDFDNPLLARAYVARTGGSRSAGTRAVVDLDLLAHDAAHHALSEAALDIGERPRAQWRPVPPAYAGLHIALRAARNGRLLTRWFAHHPVAWRAGSVRSALLTELVLRASRLHGRPIPRPEHVPLPEAATVALWLAECTRAGAPALLDAPVSSAVRVCLAAAERGLDVAGTAFRVGGEPLTLAKVRVISSAGARALPCYSLTELGNIGMPCTRPSALDEVHLLTDKIAVLQRERPVGTAGASVPALVVTTLLPASPKLMLNVDIDDYGVFAEGDCGCPLHALGLTLRLHGVRSHEKLTSEGMTFGGEGVLRLVDEVLPALFGGHAADYQLVEEEEGGLSRVTVVVSPRVGAVDEGAVATAVLEALAAHTAGWRMAAAQWRDGETLRVVRREPEATGAGKILPLHVPRATRRSTES